MKVLVAEDERNTREALVGLLEHCGHEVQAVADGQAAVQALDSQAYQLLVTDLRMPGQDGDAVIAHGLERNPTLKVIVISAYFKRSLEVLEPAQRAGIRFLVKPFRARELLGALEEVAGELEVRGQ